MARELGNRWLRWIGAAAVMSATVTMLTLSIRAAGDDRLPDFYQVETETISPIEVKPEDVRDEIGRLEARLEVLRRALAELEEVKTTQPK